MQPRRESNAVLEKHLSILAGQFRGTRDERERAAIAKEYADAVTQLINGKKWKRIPTLEDQLPDEWMPRQFFEFWSLQPPVRRTSRTG